MRSLFEGEYQDLEAVMRTRDQRLHIQMTLIRTFEKPLISYKLNIPGPVKYSGGIRQIFDSGLDAIRRVLNDQAIDLLFEKLIYENSGPEYFAVFDASPQAVKRLMTCIENEHVLGRIFDVDVYDHGGAQLSRTDDGVGLRKCLICENDAFVCSRERNHGLEALQEKIDALYRACFSIG